MVTESSVAAWFKASKQERTAKSIKITTIQSSLNVVNHLWFQHTFLPIRHFSSLDCSKSPFGVHHSFRFWSAFLFFVLKFSLLSLSIGSDSAKVSSTTKTLSQIPFTELQGGQLFLFLFWQLETSSCKLSKIFTPLHTSFQSKQSPICIQFQVCLVFSLIIIMCDCIPIV